MREFLDFLKKLITYDAERDFYARHFPSIAAQLDLASFRPMRKSDLSAILAIEQRVYQYPWSARTFRECMRIGYLCWVCERIDEVVAYGILSVGAGESHVMNICVSPDIQRQGYGRRMINKLIEIAIENRSETLLLEVRPSNSTAIRLYKNMGFNEIGTRKGYYPGPNGREDALMLALELSISQVIR